METASLRVCVLLSISLLPCRYLDYGIIVKQENTENDSLPGGVLRVAFSMTPRVLNSTDSDVVSPLPRCRDSLSEEGTSHSGLCRYLNLLSLTAQHVLSRASSDERIIWTQLWLASRSSLFFGLQVDWKKKPLTFEMFSGCNYYMGWMTSCSRTSQKV